MVKKFICQSPGHRSPVLTALMNFLLITIVISIASPSFGQRVTSPPPIVQVLWSQQSPIDKIVVNLGSLLNKKQRALLDSGFATFSQLIISEAGPGDSALELFRVACTVKMDAWDEVYELARLDEAAQTATVKEFAKYVDLCLTAEIVQQKTLTSLASGKGSLHAKIQIEQISADQANKIKDWLVRQQSGVMQGLFSHMLQEITLSETIELDIPVGPKPSGSQRSQNENPSGKFGQAK